MSDGFSQYQKSQLGVSAAKARAISERSQGTFSLGVTALEERQSLERAEEQLQQIAKDAERNARKRGRKAGLGRLIGAGIGYALGGPAGKEALGTALGGLAGTAAAGGFKEYGVDVPDSLVPGGILFRPDREKLKQRAEDLEEAMDDLTDVQRESIGKNVFTDYLTGRGLGKLGEAKIGDLGVSLDELRATGQISNKDYLKDIFRSAFGGIGEERMQVLSQLEGSNLKNVTPDKNFIKSLGTNTRMDNLSDEIREAVGLPKKANVLDFSNMDRFSMSPEPNVDASRGLFNMNVVKPEVENLELFKKTKDLDSMLGLNVSPDKLKNNLLTKPRTDEELNLQSLADLFQRFPNQFKPGVPFQQTSILNPGVAGQEFVRDRTLPFKQLLDLGVITQEEYDNFMSNPYEFSNSLRQDRNGMTSRNNNTNSLFQSTVGPMGAY